MRKTFIALVTLLGLLIPGLAFGADLESVIAQQLVADQGLFYALAQNNIPAMAALRDQGGDPNTNLARLGLRPQNIFNANLPIFKQPFNTSGWPILTWAIYLKNEQASNLLIRAGARINATDEYGATALHWAAWTGHHTLAQQLLNNGANCQAKDFKGRTPKDWAVMVSQTDMIRLLDSRTCRNYPIGDEDRDGVTDDNDLCPGTPLGAQVDERGCWIVAYATFFDLDKSIIKSMFLPHVRQAARVLANNPSIEVNIVGHTDSTGSDEYNYALGYRRAEAVKQELVRQGVSESRLTISSQGESAPIDDNFTSSGRAKNRRVEIHVAQPEGLDSASLE